MKNIIHTPLVYVLYIDRGGLALVSFGKWWHVRFCRPLVLKFSYETKLNYRTFLRKSASVSPSDKKRKKAWGKKAPMKMLFLYFGLSIIVFDVFMWWPTFPFFLLHTRSWWLLTVKLFDVLQSPLGAPFSRTETGNLSLPVPEDGLLSSDYIYSKVGYAHRMYKINK